MQICWTRWFMGNSNYHYITKYISILRRFVGILRNILLFLQKPGEIFRNSGPILRNHFFATSHHTKNGSSTRWLHARTSKKHLFYFDLAKVYVILAKLPHILAKTRGNIAKPLFTPYTNLQEDSKYDLWLHLNSEIGFLPTSLSLHMTMISA
ncbi:hypothetical protein SAMN04488577_3039 [Bacillus sp. cl95]|nr:hypothetical protein SAMN02799634_10581 [Bacillus sp. UNCCL13]SFQ87421.1 hypothetical protein SAMN04488577_3039 [Bacillus sp. cl95]